MIEMRVRRITVAAIAALALASAAGAGVAAAETNRAQTTGRALIEIRTPALPTADGRAAAERRDSRLGRASRLLERVAARPGGDVDARSDAAGLIATELGPGGIDRLRAELAGDPLVEDIRPEGRFELRYTPNEPLFSSSDFHAPGGDLFQWPLVHQGFPAAWDLSKGIGSEVAVIDTGADATHPDLALRIAGALNCNGPVCAGSDITDSQGHGTHVSGLACADSDNAYGLASAGFDCSLLVVKTDLSYISVINAIYAAANRGSDTINMSFGGSGADDSLRGAIDYAFARGTIPVAAAANEINPGVTYPAQYIQPEGSGPSIDTGKGLVVTSVAHSGARTAFAQATNGVSVAAVGSASDLRSCEGFQQGIISTWPATPTGIDAACEAPPPVPVRTSLNGDSRFAYLVGTSMASPQVAGLLALMRSANPNLAAAKAVRLVKLTASSCGKYVSGTGWGTIRAAPAVGAALNKDVGTPSSRVKSAKAVRGARGATAARRKGRRLSLKLERSDPSCSEELESSGIKAVNVFASANGGRYRRIGKTKKKRLFFKAKPGRRYRFYSVAVDKAKNRELPPETADAKRRVK